MENLCSNKIECNVRIDLKLKVDPDKKMWYVKSATTKMAHNDESF